ncbi:MAG: hypothetical protein DMG06_02460 [Acidobacteria bacterium]|nr:MAG: hypothetical protein DMG06_02460 [Acidobacteriota bacterium]
MFWNTAAISPSAVFLRLEDPFRGQAEGLLLLGLIRAENSNPCRLLVTCSMIQRFVDYARFNKP